MPLSDLLKRLGGVPLNRIRFHPFPGIATVQDVIEVKRRDHTLCELVAGTLVERAPGFTESAIAGFLLGEVNTSVRPWNLGVVTGAGGPIELGDGLVRMPDLAFTSWERMPGGKRPVEPIPRLVPNLIAEVQRRGNTTGEMDVKRQEYFTAGVQLVWEVDLVRRTVGVYTAADQKTTLGEDDTLDGGAVLPGFTLPLKVLLAELDRQG
jgi:hypothetical protein